MYVCFFVLIVDSQTAVLLMDKMSEIKWIGLDWIGLVAFILINQCFYLLYDYHFTVVLLTFTLYYKVVVCVCVFVCVCRMPRDFIENVHADRPYLICVTKFPDIVRERAIFQAAGHIDKVIIAQVASFTGIAWDMLAYVPVRDVLVMIDNFPVFPPLPAEFVIPPPMGFVDTSPPPAPTPQQYSRQSSDDGDGYIPFPRYSPISPGLQTFPGTPNRPPPELEPTAPSRPPRVFEISSSSDEEIQDILQRCDYCGRMRGGDVSATRLPHLRYCV